jgi:hypothetical protein
MPNHKLSKNICPVKDPCRTSVDHDVANSPYLIKIYDNDDITVSSEASASFFKGQKALTQRHIAEEPNSPLLRSMSKSA